MHSMLYYRPALVTGLHEAVVQLEASLNICHPAELACIYLAYTKQGSVYPAELACSVPSLY